MAKFPALPASVDRYVRETLNRMLGRTGQTGDKVLFQNDLVQLGLAKEKGSKLSLPSKEGSSITDNLEPVTVGSVPDNPTTPKDLSAAGIFGAVILEWAPPIYSGHNHTEVWRAQEDDREQASMVHEANGSRYADIVGSTTPHYYWIRHVNDAGQRSGFNQLSGVLGTPTNAIDVESLVLEHPEITNRPFTVLNVGTEETPNYVIALNADIALNGHLNINQLQSGELAQGTALTIGKGSIELSTASDGYGQMIITGQNGIANNDYLMIKEGRIESFVYTASAGHVRYKEVRRTESGTANNGQQVLIPAYFKSQPSIHLYPRDISVYNANHPTQSQRLEIWHSAPAPHPSIEGAWLFTPYAQLVLQSGTETISANWNYQGSSNAQTWTATHIKNLKGVTVHVRCKSFRRGSGTTFQNRRVEIYLDYKKTGTTAWSGGSSLGIDINQFSEYSKTLSKTLTLGNYDIRVRFIAKDRSGTFTSGSLSYDYTQARKTGTSRTLTHEPKGSAYTQKRYIELSSYALSGWEVTRINYQITLDLLLKVRNLYDKDWSLGEVFKGKAHVKIPNGKGGHTTYSATTSDNWVQWGNPWKETAHNNITITYNDTSYKDGKVRPEIELYGYKAGYTKKSSGASYVPSSHASVKVKSITATVYYRKVRSSPQTSNNFRLDSAKYDRGATNISLTNAVITWSATGE